MYPGNQESEYYSSFRIQARAVGAMHEAAEHYVIRLLEDANALAIHARQVTVQPRDIQSARRICGQRDWDKGTTDWSKVKPGHTTWLKWTVNRISGDLLCLWFHGRANQSGVGDTGWTVNRISGDLLCLWFHGRANQSGVGDTGWTVYLDLFTIINRISGDLLCLWFHGRANQSGVGDTGVNSEQDQWGFIVSVISWEGKPIRGGRHKGEPDR